MRNLTDTINILLRELELQGVKHPEVLKAIQQIPRDEFVLPEYQALAYSNQPLPIPHHQTISQPYIVAKMTELLLNGKQSLDKVLEVGTGSGYQAAILALLAKQVYSIERIEELHHYAQSILTKLKIENIQLTYGDGYLGLPEYAPFDGIIVTALAEEIPAALVEQLAINGRLVIPAKDPGNSINYLYVLTKLEDGTIREEKFDPVRFVPMLTGLE